MKKTITFFSRRAAMMLLATLLLALTAQTAKAELYYSIILAFSDGSGTVKIGGNTQLNEGLNSNVGELLGGGVIDCPLTIIPDDGYKVSSVSYSYNRSEVVGGGISGPYDCDMAGTPIDCNAIISREVGADIADNPVFMVNVVFEPIDYSIHVYVDGPGTVMINSNDVTGGGEIHNVTPRTIIQMTTMPVDGFSISSVTGSFPNFYGDKVDLDIRLPENGYEFTYPDAQIIKWDNPVVTVNIVFSPINYNITYNLDGGTNAEGNPSTYNIEDGNIVLGEPTKTGYTFGGWYDNENFDGDRIYEFNFADPGDPNREFWAKWTANTYTVHFDANGGSGAAMANQDFIYDESQNLTANTYTAPEGKAFKNWNTADDGSGESYNDEESVQNLTDVPNGIVTLYAQWVTVAKIGETVYSSVKAAMDAAKSGDVITVMEDVNEPETACGSSPSYSGAFTLNLNGHSVTLASITMSASLTVKNGTLSCIINNPDVGNGDALTLDNAEVRCEEVSKYNELHELVSYDGLDWSARNIAVTNGSMLYIMGKTFLGGGADDGFSLYIDGTSRVVLKEATLSGYNDARVRSEFAKYLPSGYSINTDGKVTSGGSEYTDPVTLSTIALVDNADNSAIIIANASSENNVTLQDRTLYRDGDWNTLCLPFAVSNFTGTPLEGATVMELDVDNKYNGSGIIDNQNGTFQTGLDGSTLYLYFKDATSIVAGNPYIIKWGNKDSHPDTDITNPVFSGVTISSTTPTLIKSTDTNVGFIGNYNRVTLTGGDASNLYLGVKDGKNTLFWPSSDRQINAFRAYFIIYPLQSGGGQAPDLKIVLNFGEDENTTGIIEVNTNNTNLTNKAEGVFDLQGRRIANGQKPTAKGLYIVNGKKVVIK